MRKTQAKEVSSPVIMSKQATVMQLLKPSKSANPSEPQGEQDQSVPTGSFLQTEPDKKLLPMKRREFKLDFSFIKV